MPQITKMDENKNIVILNLNGLLFNFRLENGSIYASVDTMILLFNNESPAKINLCGYIIGGEDTNRCDFIINDKIKRFYLWGWKTKNNAPFSIRMMQIFGQKMVDFYNLDVIVSVGYSVSAPFTARLFEQWAHKKILEYSLPSDDLTLRPLTLIPKEPNMGELFSPKDRALHEAENIGLGPHIAQSARPFGETFGGEIMALEKRIEILEKNNANMGAYIKDMRNTLTKSRSTRS